MPKELPKSFHKENFKVSPGPALQNVLDVWRLIDLGVSKNSGTPKWMVKIMDIPIKMDDLGDTPILKNMQTVKLDHLPRKTAVKIKNI